MFFMFYIFFGVSRFVKGESSTEPQKLKIFSSPDNKTNILEMGSILAFWQQMHQERRA